MGIISSLEMIPFPPSVNEANMPICQNGKARIINAPILRQYKKVCEIYRLQNLRHLATLKNSIAGKPIYLEIIFYIHWNRIICQDGTIQQFDTSNRLKYVEDAIATMLGVDDKHNWKISGEKNTIGLDSYECCTAIFHEYTPKPMLS